MYNMAKNSKTDISESKIIPVRNFLVLNEQKKLKIHRNLQENVIKDYVIFYVITFV